MQQNSFINRGTVFVLLVTGNDDMIVYWIVSHLFYLMKQLSLCWTCICFLIPVWAAFLYLITFSGKVL